MHIYALFQCTILQKVSLYKTKTELKKGWEENKYK